MAQEEVLAVAECGPYKSFSNGDLETFSGVFDGKEENFQFFFSEKRLRRIGVYLYEGQDPKVGAKVWLALHGTMTRFFGPLETPGNFSPAASEAAAASFEAKALEMVDGSGKTQMAPLAQPEDKAVFSSYMRREVNGENYYYVVLYFDSP
ncbi:hypothetical protein [Pseudoxanthomonas composti]|uniref:Uncharacterized protein n=1 Tax=Pseudoxanthomonas composti TaxID=2137479 RepID=A0A4Q1JVC3_9GAMM|nr:hypothetical protein [Pseudoxanthomonas composti]RXR06099.1 hypothetical protein EPA99_09680 [Pseudoxanthomonas composti]